MKYENMGFLCVQQNKGITLLSGTNAPKITKLTCLLKCSSKLPPPSKTSVASQDRQQTEETKRESCKTKVHCNDLDFYNCHFIFLETIVMSKRECHIFFQNRGTAGHSYASDRSEVSKTLKWTIHVATYRRKEKNQGHNTANIHSTIIHWDRHYWQRIIHSGKVHIQLKF